MKRLLLGAIAVGVLVALAAVLGREGAAEPFGLESRPVDRMEAASEQELADAIVAQLPHADRRSQRDDVFNEWIDLLRQTVYRDQAPRNGLPPEAPLVLGLGGIGGEERANRAYLTASENAMRRLVRANAQRLDMQLLSIDFLHPEGIPVPVAVAYAPPALGASAGGAPRGGCVLSGVAAAGKSVASDVVNAASRPAQWSGTRPPSGQGPTGGSEGQQSPPPSSEPPTPTDSGGAPK